MATIHKLKRHRNYYAMFRIAGHQYCRSTGYEHSPEDPQQKELNRRWAIAKADYMERLERSRVNVAIPITQDYLRAYAATRSKDPDTMRRTKNTIEMFLGLLGAQASSPLTMVSHSHVLSYRDLRGREIEASTVNTELSTLNIVFERAVEQGVLHVSPVHYVDDLMPESSSVRLMELWEVQALLLATSQVDWRTCIYIGFYTARQLVDSAYRRWSEVTQDASGQWYLAFPGNGRKLVKQVLIHPALRDHLQSLRRENDYICPNLAALKRWTNDSNFVRIAAEAKLGEGITFRCLRHIHAKLINCPIKRLDVAGPTALLDLPDIRVAPLPCQLPEAGS